MAATPLVDRDIEAGRRLVQALDKSGFGLTAAFWNYLIDQETWRLIVASAKVSDVGPRAAYAAVDEVLASSAVELSLHDITVAAPSEELVLKLRLYKGTDAAPFVGGKQLSTTVVGSVYVESAYLYRAERFMSENGASEMTAVIRDRVRRVWNSKPCRITFENGFLKRIDVEGVEWRQTQTKKGVNARIDLLNDVERKRNDVYGDVLRLTYRGGRLCGDEIVARGARVEGFHEAHAAPQS